MKVIINKHRFLFLFSCFFFFFFHTSSSRSTPAAFLNSSCQTRYVGTTILLFRQEEHNQNRDVQGIFSIWQCSGHIFLSFSRITLQVLFLEFQLVLQFGTFQVFSHFLTDNKKDFKKLFLLEVHKSPSKVVKVMSCTKYLARLESFGCVMSREWHREKVETRLNGITLRQGIRRWLVFSFFFFLL